MEDSGKIIYLFGKDRAPKAPDPDPADEELYDEEEFEDEDFEGEVDEEELTEEQLEYEAWLRKEWVKSLPKLVRRQCRNLVKYLCQNRGQRFLSVIFDEKKWDVEREYFGPYRKPEDYADVRDDMEDNVYQCLDWEGILLFRFTDQKNRHRVCAFRLLQKGIVRLPAGAVANLAAREYGTKERPTRNVWTDFGTDECREYRVKGDWICEQAPIDLNAKQKPNPPRGGRKRS